MSDPSKRSYLLYLNDDFLNELDMLVVKLRQSGISRENGDKFRRIDLFYEALDLLKEKYKLESEPRYDSYIIRMQDED